MENSLLVLNFFLRASLLAKPQILVFFVQQ